MKKEYKELELETVEFKSEDVITASGDCPLDAVLPCDADGGLICDCDRAYGEQPCDCLAPAFG